MFDVKMIQTKIDRCAENKLSARTAIARNVCDDGDPPPESIEIEHVPVDVLGLQLEERFDVSDPLLCARIVVLTV